MRTLKQQVSDLKAEREQLLAKSAAKENRIPLRKPAKPNTPDEQTGTAELREELHRQAEALGRAEEGLQHAREQVLCLRNSSLAMQFMLSSTSSAEFIDPMRPRFSSRSAGNYQVRHWCFSGRVARGS